MEQDDTYHSGFMMTVNNRKRNRRNTASKNSGTLDKRAGQDRRRNSVGGSDDD